MKQTLSEKIIPSGLVVLGFTFIFLIGCSKNAGLSRKKAGLDVRVSAYNIRYESKSDDLAGNGWAVRKAPLAKLIIDHKFDIIGTQEGNTKQLNQLKYLLKGFDYISEPYGGPDGNLHNCATYYKTDAFKVLSKGVFWLSQTPDTPSIGWDATDRRICQWIKFKDLKSGDEFYFFNAHFYFRNKEAREQSGNLMVAKIKEIASGSPVVCLGDFNSTPEMPQIRNITTYLKDCFQVAERKEGPDATFPGGRFHGEPKVRLDYIFVSNHFKVLDFRTLSDIYGENKYPSDHLPVTSRIVLR